MPQVAVVLRQVLRTFLALPSLVILGFVLLAAATYAVDAAVWGGFQPDQGSRGGLLSLLGDANAASSLLATVSTSLATITSITFSMLLISLQQGAASLTNQVYDLFLNRRLNQFFFGYFVGLTIFALFNLSTVSKAHQPVLGMLVTLVLTGVALCAIIVLIYTTVAQMQPAVVVRDLTRYVARARAAQGTLLARTRRSCPSYAHSVLIQGWRSGFLGAVELERLEAAAHRHRGLTIDLRLVIGQHVAWSEVLAELRSAEPLSPKAVEDLSTDVRRALVITDQRELAADAAYGLEQLLVIAWTATSTAKSNPGSAAVTLKGLRGLLLRWCGNGDPGDETAAVVYRDGLFAGALRGLDNLAVVASESMQASTLAEIYLLYAALLRPASATERRLIEAAVLTSTTCLGDHVATRDLREATDALAAALDDAGCSRGGAAVREALDALARLDGRLSSRGSRATARRGADG